MTKAKIQKLKKVVVKESHVISESFIRMIEALCKLEKELDPKN